MVLTICSVACSTLMTLRCLRLLPILGCHVMWNTWTLTALGRLRGAVLWVVVLVAVVVVDELVVEVVVVVVVLVVVVLVLVVVVELVVVVVETHPPM